MTLQADAAGEVKVNKLGSLDSRRQLLVRPRHREGRRTHLSSRDPEQKRVFSDWDGQSSWEWDNPRTMYFEPVAGLGNRLRALGMNCCDLQGLEIGIEAHGNVKMLTLSVLLRVYIQHCKNAIS